MRVSTKNARTWVAKAIECKLLIYKIMAETVQFASAIICILWEKCANGQDKFVPEWEEIRRPPLACPARNK